MMGTDKFSAQWTHILDQYKARRERAQAYLDQEASKLFKKSGWTQQRIADAVGKSRVWVSYRLRYGAFLDFVTTVTNHKFVPSNLTERKFRSYWEKSSGRKDEPRFRKVLDMMEADSICVSSPKNVGEVIAEKFADGKYRHYDTLAESLEVEEGSKVLSHAITRIRNDNAHSLMVTEKASTGGRKKYAFKPVTEKAKTRACMLVEKIHPLIEDALRHLHAKIPQDAIHLAECDVKTIRKILKEYIA